MSTIEDTIAAIATPHGRGGIAIVRVSGPQALTVAKTLTNITPKTRQAYFKQFKLNNEVIDEGVLLYFASPNSYTGEDVIELQGHGGNIAPQRVLNAVLSIDGVRQAEPGEFTKRAFLNGRIDLSQAEGIIDLINSKTEMEAKESINQLEGSLSKKIKDYITNNQQLKCFLRTD